MYVIVRLEVLTAANIMRTVVTLLSNQDHNLYPNNSSTKFANLLPAHIYPRRGFNKLFVRLLNACIPVIPGVNKIAWLFLNEIEGSVLYRTVHDHCLGQVKLDSRLANKDSVQFHEFRHSCFNRVNAVPLYRLNVLIADEKGNEISDYIFADQPTSVTLEIMDEIETGDHFEVIGYSRGVEKFPTNKVYDFNIALPYEVSLDDTWEVAMTSMTIPPNIVWNKYWISLNREIVYLDVTSIATSQSIAQDIINAIDKSRVANILKVGFGKSKVTGNQQLVFWMNKVSKDEDNAFPGGILVILSKAVMKILKSNSDPTAESSLRFTAKAGKGKQIDMGNNPRTQVRLPHYAPIGLIYCSAVKPNIVGGSLKPLLQIVPLGEYIFSPTTNFFEPKNLIYKDTLNQKFSFINIKIRDSQNYEFPIDHPQFDDPTGALSIMLKFRKKQDMDTYLNPFN